MVPEFKVRKAAQVIAYFAMAEGGAINVLKLVKLIYLADRAFMLRYDRPILNDRLVSMDHGPVNSITLNYINGCEVDRENWDSFVADRAGHDVALARAEISEDDLDELSEAELVVLRDVWARYRDYSSFRLANHTHKHCPEWEDPRGSSNPIPYERVFKFLDKPNAAELAAEVESERSLDRILAAE